MIKLIGYGNPFRKDDAIGIWIVSRIKYIIKPPKKKMDFWMGQQLVPEIVEWIQDADEVVFIDSSLMTGTQKGWDFIKITPKKDVLTDNMFHSLDIADLLVLSRKEYGNIPDSFLLAITGYDFSFGAGLTEKAKKASYEAIKFLKQRYNLF